MGSELYRKEYIEEIVSKWRDELPLLSKIAVIQFHAAYSTYMDGFESKWNFFNRTIPTTKYAKSNEDF